MNYQRRIVWIFSLLAVTLLSLPVVSQTAKDTAVMVSASVTDSPPAIMLSWPAATATSYAVSRKGLRDTSWTVLTNSLPGTATSFIDVDVAVSSNYEYRVYKSASTVGYGYVYAGIQSGLIENRGSLILLVDDQFTSSLATELSRLERDLVGDGWKVIRHDVSSGAAPADVKASIVADYNSAPSEIKALLLFGHIPQPYSGDQYLYPDGHDNHRGAWPADVFYGDVDGVWTDTDVTCTLSTWTRQHNVPGDGKYDQRMIPSPVDLQVGRVDFYNMPAFALSEEELLRQYLNKDHKFRCKFFTAVPRMLIDDHFGYFSGEAFAASAWRGGASCFGASSVYANDFFTTLDSDSYLMSYGCGGGSFTSANGIGTTTDFTDKDVNSVFTFLFGSYFGDWDNQNNFLRAPLASSPWALTCGWSGRPHWHMHHMALGLPIGYSALVTQNNNSGLYQRSSYGGYVHIGLMGDPTLRLHPVAPPSQITTSTNASGSVVLEWNESADTVEGYHVYRSDNLNGPYTRLTTTLEASTVFVDSAPPAGTNLYMVRAVKLQESGGGTYFNPSQGAFGIYPDNQVSLTVNSVYGDPVPSVGMGSYPVLDATVLCSMPGNVIDLGDIQLVATGWTGSGSVPSSGSTNETPLIDLTENSVITWQWRTNFWLSVSSDENGGVDLSSGWYADGSTVTLTAIPTAFRYAFSHWSGAGVPSGMESVNPLEVPVDSAMEIFANFAPAPNPDNRLVFVETFENYPPDMPLSGTNGWHARFYDSATVSTNSEVINSISSFGLNQSYPVNTSHFKAGTINADTSLNVVSPSNSTVTTRMLLKMTPAPDEQIPAAESMTNQLALTLSDTGEILLLHGTPVTGEKYWTRISGETYDADKCHVLTLEIDYGTVGLGSRYFRVSVDYGPWLTHTRGYTLNDGTGSPGGEWFAFGDSQAQNLNSLSVRGNAVLDDIVIAEKWNGQGGSGDQDNDGMWDFWELSYFGSTNNPSGDALADWDNDGFNNISEWLADTSPNDTNSVLLIRNISVEGSGVRVSWQGGRDATQYLEWRDNLLTGSWKAIFTNIPPNDVVNELLDAGTPSPSGFYRIRAVR